MLELMRGSLTATLERLVAFGVVLDLFVVGNV
jgi:hypothetical protein